MGGFWLLHWWSCFEKGLCLQPAQQACFKGCIVWYYVPFQILHYFAHKCFVQKKLLQFAYHFHSLAQSGVYCVVYIMHYELWIVHCTLCSGHCAVYIQQWALWSVYCAMCIVQCALCCVYYIVCFGNFVLCSVLCLICFVKCVLCSVYCAVHFSMFFFKFVLFSVY